MIPLWMIIGILVAVVLLVAGSGFAYKMLNRSKRLMDLALVHATGHDTSVKSIIDSPTVKQLPPNVRVKMIVNWIDKFYIDHVKTQMQRLDQALKRINTLERSRHKADLGLKYEILQLSLTKRHLFNQGIGLVSASTQTKMKLLKSDSKPTKKKHRVRFITPIIWTKKSIAKHKHFITVSKWFARIKKCFLIVWPLINFFVKYLRKPTELQNIAMIIANWLENLLSIETSVDLENDKMTIVIKILSFLPTRIQYPRDGS